MEVRKMINTWYMQWFCVCCFFHERLDHFSKSIYEFSCKDTDCRQTDTHAFRKLSYINYANENFFFGLSPTLIVMKIRKCKSFTNNKQERALLNVIYKNIMSCQSNDWFKCRFSRKNIDNAKRARSLGNYRLKHMLHRKWIILIMKATLKCL